MSGGVKGSVVDCKSIVILSELLYVKPVHKDCFSQVICSIREKRRGGGEEARVPLTTVSWLFTATGEEEMTIYWESHKGD